LLLNEVSNYCTKSFRVDSEVTCMKLLKRYVMNTPLHIFSKCPVASRQGSEQNSYTSRLVTRLLINLPAFVTCRKKKIMLPFGHQNKTASLNAANLGSYRHPASSHSGNVLVAIRM